MTPEQKHLEDKLMGVDRNWRGTATNCLYSLESMVRLLDNGVSEYVLKCQVHNMMAWGLGHNAQQAVALAYSMLHNDGTSIPMVRECLVRAISQQKQYIHTLTKED